MGKSKNKRSESIANGNLEEQISGMDKDDIDALLADFMRNVPETERENLLGRLKSRFQKRRMTVEDIKNAVDPKTLGTTIPVPEKRRDSVNILADLQGYSNHPLGFDQEDAVPSPGIASSRKFSFFGIREEDKIETDLATEIGNLDGEADAVLTEVLSLIFELNLVCEETQKDMKKKVKEKSKDKKKKNKEKKAAENRSEIFNGLDFKAEDITKKEDDSTQEKKLKADDKTSEKENEKEGETIEAANEAQENETNPKQEKKKKAKLNGFFRSSKQKNTEINETTDTDNKGEQPTEEKNDKKKKSKKKDKESKKKVSRKVSFKDGDLANNTDLQNLTDKHLENGTSDEDEKSEDKQQDYSFIIFAKSLGSSIKKKFTFSRDEEDDINYPAAHNEGRRQSLAIRALKIGCLYA